MRRLTPLLTLIMILAMVAPVFAGSPASVPSKTIAEGAKSYVVFMEGLPAVAYDGADAKFPATKPAAGASFDVTSEAVKAYTDSLADSHDRALVAAGISEVTKVHDYTIAFNGFSALLSPEQATELEKSPGVALVIEDEFRYKETDNSGTFLGLDVPGAAYSKGINGEGVVVGVIDSGIWPEHPSFADDGSYPHLPGFGSVPCEFGNTAHNPADAPFECNNKLLGARQTIDTYRALIGADADEFDSARDDDGHGSHTASTAAGNYGVPASIFGIDRGMVTGVAYRARIIAYKGLGKLGGFTSDLAASIDQAVADGVDVINYSIGGGAGGPSADEISFLFAADAGVYVATSAGNSGPGPATLGNPGTMPWMTTVGASTQNRTFQGSASSSDGWEFFGASITPSSAELPLVDAADYGNELCLPETPFTGDITGKIVLCKRGSSARVAKSQAVFLAGGAGTILYNAVDPDSIVTDNHWTPAVHISNADGLVIKDYIATAATPVAMINGGVFTPIDAPWMAAFSSRGQNPEVSAPDLIKPDVTAPGVNILAAASPVHNGADAQGEYFQSISGTSMSSPHVAGLFALIKQVHPDWSAAAAKSAIMTTAHQDVMKEDGVTPADPFDFGAGHIDPSGKPLGKHTPWNPGLVYDAGLFEYAAFTCGMDWGVFTPGSCDFLESIGVPSDPSDLNVPSIGIAELAGSQTVQRTVTFLGKRGTFRAYVEAPEGYKVTVEPDVLRLNGGDTATFLVTITNDGTGVPGEWSFGSLTWMGANKARIPIAVKGALFDAPAAVSGEGTEGSTSFDVLFGYEGDYTAAPHGLEAPIMSTDTIYQDPDQTYPSSDDGNGVDRWDFPISGAAFVRFSLVIPGDDDIDLFLEDSAGNIVASSTQGGTDELIELVLPADDTYTMVVHGWSVPSEPLEYTLYTWVISATPGGSLNVDSAPTEATVGDTGTINLSWSGLDPNTQYLGAVSHADASGLLGLTLVEVDTTAAPTAE